MARSRGSAIRRLVCCIGMLPLLMGWLPAPPVAAVTTQDLPVTLLKETTGDTPGDQAGFPAVTNGTFSAFGAANAKVGGHFAAGEVYVSFSNDNGLTWSGPTVLTDPNPATGYLFGSSIAIRGNFMAVGEEGATVNGQTGAGRVFMYGLNPATGGITPLQTITPQTAHHGDGFGGATDFSSDATKLVVGALQNSSGTPYVDLYALVNNQYAFQSEITDAPFTDFGVSVAVSADGTIVIVGAQFTSNQVGAAYAIPILQNNQFGAKVPLIQKPAPGANAVYGGIAAISGDGTTAFVGGRGDATMSVFKATNNGQTWTQTDTLMLPDHNPPSALAILSNNAGHSVQYIVGDSAADDGINPVLGAVVPFDATTSPPTPGTPIVAPDRAALDFYGQALGVSPTRPDGTFNLVVGAIGQANGTGKMYIYGGQVPAARAITLSPSTLPDGAVGVPYSQIIVGPGCFDVCAWTVAGTLPPGLSMATIKGTPVDAGVYIGGPPTAPGKPTTPGTYTFTVTATAIGLGDSGSQQYTVIIGPPVVTTVAITCEDAIGNAVIAVKVGDNVDCFATATYSDGSKRDVTTQGSWTTDNPLASVDASGHVTGMATGVVRIRITVQGVSGETGLNVDPGRPFGLAPVVPPQSRPAGTTSQPAGAPAPKPNPIPTGR